MFEFYLIYHIESMGWTVYLPIHRQWWAFMSSFFPIPSWSEQRIATKARVQHLYAYSGSRSLLGGENGGNDRDRKLGEFTLFRGRISTDRWIITLSKTKEWGDLARPAAASCHLAKLDDGITTWPRHGRDLWKISVANMMVSKDPY